MLISKLIYYLNKIKKVNEDIEDTDESDIETYSDESDEERIRNKFKLKDGKYIYEFKYKKKKYKCTLDEDTIHFLYNDITLRYRIGDDIIKIDTGVISKYNINTKKCDTDECAKYKTAINIFINNVLK